MAPPTRTATTPSLAEMARATGNESTAAEDPVPPDPDANGRQSSESAGVPGAPPSGVRLSARYLRSVAQVMADAAEALDHAHRAGVVHRDLKPSNLLVDRTEHCWVVDFGLARLLESTDAVPETSAGCGDAADLQRLTDGRAGTPALHGPRSSTRGVLDARTDVWGLGVTLYELLTLRRAFDAPDRIACDDPPRPRDQVRGLPADLNAICWKAIRKEPAYRYQSAADLAEDLRRWLRFEPIRAPPPPTLSAELHSGPGGTRGGPRRSPCHSGSS